MGFKRLYVHYHYWISLPLFLSFVKLRAAHGRPINNSMPALGQANSIWSSHYWWLRTFPWISPFFQCCGSASCDFNLRRGEKVPNTVIFWWELIFTLQCLDCLCVLDEIQSISVICIIWHISNTYRASNIMQCLPFCPKKKSVCQKWPSLN